MGWLSWDIGSDNTNSLYLTSQNYSVLARYAGGSQKIYKCPADNRLSPAQLQRGWTEQINVLDERRG
jgi:hypothetical protein